MSKQLEYNLTSGSSYLTQNSDNPKVDGQIIYDNLDATATILFGEEYTDEDMEIVIDALGSGIDGFYDEDVDPQELAEAVDARAKRRGGTGWLNAR